MFCQANFMLYLCKHLCPPRTPTLHRPLTTLAVLLTVIPLPRLIMAWKSNIPAHTCTAVSSATPVVQSFLCLPQPRPNEDSTPWAKLFAQFPYLPRCRCC